MAEELRRKSTGREEPVQERQGVREPQPIEPDVERDRPERKVGDKVPGEARDQERERESERAPDEPAEGPREAQEPRTTHVE